MIFRNKALRDQGAAHTPGTLMQFSAIVSMFLEREETHPSFTWSHQTISTSPEIHFYFIRSVNGAHLLKTKSRIVTSNYI